jgi:hypothetical protein
MSVNIVSSYTISLEFKKSRYFVQSLGLVATVEKNGTRILNDKDKFSKFYNSSYRTTIYAQGKVGDIRFYIDHAIKDDNFAVYVGDNFEEFINTFDREIVSNKGIDFYLGHLLKMAEEAYEEKVKNDELKKIEEKKQGDANKIFQNPGNVTYEDLKAYMEQRQRDRYKNNNNMI